MSWRNLISGLWKFGGRDPAQYASGEPVQPPPPDLDGATVVYWAWRAPEPFFEMPVTGGSPSIPIHGLAICRYADSSQVYSFSCDASWEVMNDSPCGNSLDAALERRSAHYDIERVAWRVSDGVPSADDRALD